MLPAAKKARLTAVGDVKNDELPMHINKHHNNHITYLLIGYLRNEMMEHRNDRWPGLDPSIPSQRGRERDRDR